MPIERRNRFLRGVELFRFDAHGGERHGNQRADALLVIDHEGEGAAVAV